MPDPYSADLIEKTAEIVAAYVTKNHVQAAELPALIATVHASLSGIGSAPKAAAELAKLVPPVSIRKSVTDEYLISMEDGKQYQSLKRHLAKHGLTPEIYRQKWGCRPTVPWWHLATRPAAPSWRRISAWATIVARADAPPPRLRTIGSAGATELRPRGRGGLHACRAARP